MTATLPQETIDNLVTATVAVCTRIPERRAELRGELETLRREALARGADWDIEREFAGALIAVIDGTPPLIAPGSPYAPHVRRALETIQRLQSGAPSGIAAQVLDVYRQGGAAAVRHVLTQAGASAALIDSLLEELAQTEGVPPPSDTELQAGQLASQLVQIYQRGGSPAVRQALTQAGMLPDAIEALVARIEQAAGTATMPDDTIDMLVNVTITARTSSVPGSQETARIELEKLRLRAQEGGDQWAIELAFAEALLAIVDGGTAVLPDDNPYARHVRRVLDALQPRSPFALNVAPMTPPALSPTPEEPIIRRSFMQFTNAPAPFAPGKPSGGEGDRAALASVLNSLKTMVERRSADGQKVIRRADDLLAEAQQSPLDGEALLLKVDLLLRAVDVLRLTQPDALVLAERAAELARRLAGA